MAYTPIVLTNYDDDLAMIRHYLDTDTADVSNATLEEYGFLPYVEAQVASVITDYVAILAAGGANMYRLKTGVAAWTAALLCQRAAINEGGSVQIGDYQEGASRLDWRQKAADLIRQAAEALASITTRTHTRRTLLGLAGPTRSGGNVPLNLEAWLERIQPRFLDWLEEGGGEDD